MINTAPTHLCSPPQSQAVWESQANRTLLLATCNPTQTTGFPPVDSWGMFLYAHSTDPIGSQIELHACGEQSSVFDWTFLPSHHIGDGRLSCSVSWSPTSHRHPSWDVRAGWCPCQTAGLPEPRTTVPLPPQEACNADRLTGYTRGYTSIESPGTQLRVCFQLLLLAGPSHSPQQSETLVARGWDEVVAHSPDLKNWQ